jgi:hypothetical protein
MSQGTVKIFHEEIIRIPSPALLDRLVQQFHIGTAAFSVFSPHLSLTIAICFRTARVQNSSIVRFSDISRFAFETTEISQYSI